MKKGMSIALMIIMILMMITGCSKSSKTSGGAKNVTLNFLLFDALQYEYFTETDNLADAYKKVRPNVTIEMEAAKDSEQFAELLKIRNSANELPDLMVLKPYMLSKFKDVMVPLNDLEANKNNLFAEQFAVDGNVVGIPEISFYEFVYYRKSIFEAYGLEVPTTWDQFIDVSLKIKEKNEFIPILLGAKDAWPDYPYNEFMPSLEASDGMLWSKMATQDAPFTKGEPFYEAYAKIDKLYKSEVFGEDPLGIGFDQAKAMFVAKEGAMIAAGQWFMSDYKSMEGDMDDLGLFLLPTRNKETDTFNTIAMVDSFISTPKGYENEEESKKFIEWYFSSDYYKEYLKAKGVNPTVKGIKADNPLFQEPFERVEVNYIVYDGGNEDYNKIVDSFGFDVKKLGQEMLAGKDLDTMMEELNKHWKEGRKNLK